MAPAASGEPPAKEPPAVQFGASVSAQDAEMGAGDRDLLRLLPALPTPDTHRMRSESLIGTIAVLVIGGLCVVAANAATLVSLVGGSRRQAPAWGAPLVYGEAAVALLCLCGLLFGDPGVVPRSEANCLPLPPEVRKQLQRGGIDDHSLLQLNIGENGETYCVRCFVWRRSRKGGEGVRFHHCSICQRCVAHFDHHCGMFGRCIAGSLLSGNLKYFYTIMAMAVLGVVTAMAVATVSTPV